MEPRLSSTDKALRINLNRQIYGSFAEIGAGQEVAGHFFKAGGASGTVAKTMSAYDMAFSDAIYGATKKKRYVCQPRLMKMINHEYDLLELRLKNRKEDTCFFAFANTCVAINYHKTNHGHGWMGLKFQLNPNSAPNEVILHMNHYDQDTLRQYENYGTVGTNLIYACFYYHDDHESFIKSLIDNIPVDMVDVDMIKFSGPDFQHVDNRLMSLKLVKLGLSRSALFGPDGKVLQGADYFYKKNIFALRSRFRPVTKVNMEMYEKAYSMFQRDLSEDDKDKELAPVMELTLNNLRSEGVIDDQDFLDRADVLGSMGYVVMISNYQRYFKLVEYFAKVTKGKIGLSLSILNLENIFIESYYDYLPGGILESFSTLFSKDVKLYAYPSKSPVSNILYDLHSFNVEDHLVHLYQHLIINNKIEAIEDFTEEYLEIQSDDALESIQMGDDRWESMVPKDVVKIVKENHLFGYKQG